MARDTEQLVDEILVLDCQSGRPKAVELLVGRWQKRLWRHAYALTGDADAAWDVTQEGWLSIVRGISRLNDPARFGPWAYRIVTNKANDWLRRTGRRFERQVAAMGTEAAAAGPDQQHESSDLYHVLRRLSPPCRTVLSLHYLEGFGLADVARILRIPKGTVKSRLFRAREEFRKLWESLCEAPQTPA